MDNVVTYFSAMARTKPHSGMSSHFAKKSEFPSPLDIPVAVITEIDPRCLELDATTIRRRCSD